MSALTLAVPDELRSLIVAEAESRKVSTGAVVRTIVAGYFEFNLPQAAKRGRASKYGSIEERKAAYSVKAKERNTLVKQLVAAFLRGEFKLSDIVSETEAA